MRFLSKIRRAVKLHGVFPGPGPVVAAVSGGPDSMALLEALTLVPGSVATGEARDGALPRRDVVVAHLHHGLRESADADAEFVRAEAERRGLRFVMGREDVKRVSREEKLSLEAAARKVRYDFLARAAGDHGAKTVALGHNADDQAETVLLRLFRGTGLRGLGGMRAVRPLGGEDPGIVIFRPLLEITRAEIMAFLSERGVAFREDETNRDVRFMRNRLRLEIMPAIRERVQPRLTAVLCRLAALAREASDYVEGEAAAHVARGFRGHDTGADRPDASCGGGTDTARPPDAEGRIVSPESAQAQTAIPRDLWRSLPPALRGPALARLFESAAGRSLLHSHVEAVRSLADADGRGEIDLPGGWRARVSADGIALVPPGEEAKERVAPWRVELSVPGRAELPPGRGVAGGRTITAEVRERGPHDAPPRATDPEAFDEWADYDEIGRPGTLVVRSREPGDAFRPLGSPGEKSVKRFLVDLKIPREERARVPVVTTVDGRIVWIAPHRLDHGARVTDSTREVLVLRLS